MRHTVHPRPGGGDLQSRAMRSLQKSDVSQPSVQASETPAQRRQRGHWLDALAASATRARR
ncbi:hypothetical protein, partial [Xanthomonas perforans]|uniref:hypothetical protein n=1 Tax=Xanthomonas perforans TaxID=442694 RepID=UPI001F43893F